MSAGHEQNHPYHLVDPSPWPLFGAISGGVLAIGMVFFMHEVTAWLLPHRRRAGHRHDVLLVAPGGERGDPPGPPQQGGPARPALRHGAVHRLGGDVLRRLLLGLLRCQPLRGRGPAGRTGRTHRRGLAAGRCRGLPGLPPAVPQHHDPAALRLHGHLGAPRAHPRRPPGAAAGPGADHPSWAFSSPPFRPTSTAMPPSASPTASTPRPSTWPPVSTASTCWSAPSS